MNNVGLRVLHLYYRVGSIIEKNLPIYIVTGIRAISAINQFIHHDPL